MNALGQLMANHPIVPYIRECSFAMRKSWTVPERRLLDYLLVYIQEGHCRFTVDGQIYDLQAGEFCLVQPESLIRLEGLTDTVTPFAHFDIFYYSNREQSFPTRPGQVELSAYREFIQPRLDEVCGHSFPVRLQPKDAAKFAHTILQMVECWQHRDAIMQLKAQKLATDIVIMVLEDHLPTRTVDRTLTDSLNWITSYLSIHISEPISLDDMARRANLSPSWFSTLFKKTYGVPPHQFLLDMRIDHAKELLGTTELPLDAVATYCGFANLSHFSKSFKKRVGVSPGQYRLVNQP